MNDTVTLAHGAGGRQTAELISRVFKEHFNNPYFTADDASVLPAPTGKIAMTTDGFIVSPAFFPGGNIGKLSVCGTVNDLTCMGAKPLYMTCAFVIEEGFAMADLEKIAAAMEETAKEVGVVIVAGDTKVAGRGQVDGCFITTTGVGQVMDGIQTSGRFAAPGDAVIVTGDIGRHGTAILLARDEYGIEADVKTDCAPLWNPIHALLTEVPDVHVIRDATRGGVGTVLYEIAKEAGVGIAIEREKIPVTEGVLGVTGMLGLEPLYLACEGTMVVFVPMEHAQKAIDVLRQQDHTRGAAVIGQVQAENKGRVIIQTQLGAKTILPEPGNELLPRIC
jgi:hydrogenase expression/formation protein HypE